ncbi:hypothetical protein WI29_18045 [Burkholderia ubonensis]|nr:hypothetical protein WI31_03715 [Burkholderia ubonensis]KUZ17428.1 hypothetical protein WI29_18045 [Burkholderia ubonensis]KUZ31204.1 hypothetical protein WI32_01070 [Burkholderia ubonensis]KUZ37977.1 hypothetical protein WI30_04830 [Burkholderia ubonensis]KUZ39977.1 hypothetical protein WI33_34545 [Burkholderia ubonensis]
MALSAALWLAVTSALLYSQGRAYRDAYLITYGVDAELLPWDRGALAYWGMVVGAQGFLKSVLLPTVAISMWVVLVWLATEWLLNRRGARASSRAPAGEPRSIPFVIRGCFGVAAATVLVAAVLLGFQWIQYEAQSRGMDDAQREMRMIASCGRPVFDSPGYRPVHVERAIAGGRETHDGFITTCTDKRCALYDPLQQRTQVVSLDQVIRFDTVQPEQVYWRESAGTGIKPWAGAE